MFLAACFAAWAAAWTAEDLVLGYQQGIPVATLAERATSVGGGSDTVVYLLRRGLSNEVIRALGYAVGGREAVDAARLGPITAGSGVSDTDWFEMQELPATIERRGERPVAGEVVEIDGSHVLLSANGNTVEITRAQAQDIWLDASALRAEIDVSFRVVDQQARAQRRRSEMAIGLGTTSAVIGGLVFFGSLAGMSTVSVASDGRWNSTVGETSTTRVGRREPGGFGMAVGALAMLGGGVTVHFGVRQLNVDGFDPRRRTADRDVVTVGGGTGEPERPAP